MTQIKLNIFLECKTDYKITDTRGQWTSDITSRDLRTTSKGCTWRNKFVNVEACKRNWQDLDNILLRYRHSVVQYAKLFWHWKEHVTLGWEPISSRYNSTTLQNGPSIYVWKQEIKPFTSGFDKTFAKLKILIPFFLSVKSWFAKLICTQYFFYCRPPTTI